jgi:hypothetical protein
MPNYIQVKNTNIGSIQIHKGINQGLYSNLGQANSYLAGAINGSYSNVFLDTTNDILFFDVHQGTYTFDNFLSATGAFIIDLNNLLQYADNCFNENNTGNNIIGLDGSDTYFGADCFVQSSGNNTFLGNCFAGSGFFKDSIGNNTFKNVDCGKDSFMAITGKTIIEDGFFAENAFLTAISNVTINNIIDADYNFGKSFIGNFTIKGDIGATDTADLTGTTSFFDNGSGANLIVLASKATSNSGSPEGDLDNAVTNGATVNYVLI